MGACGIASTGADRIKKVIGVPDEGRLVSEMNGGIYHAGRQCTCDHIW